MAKLLVQKLIQKCPFSTSLQLQNILAAKSGLNVNKHFIQPLPNRSFHFTTLHLADIYYTQTHEWIRVDKNVATIGITDYAQGQLGDIVYCDLPEISTKFEKGECFATVESVKAASDLYMPVKGEITEENKLLVESPSLINESPLDKGWIVKVKLDESAQKDVKTLLDHDGYEKFKQDTDE